MSARILLLFSHPAYQRSRINRALVQAVYGMEGLTFHDLYEVYPDFMIDDVRERELLLAHDVIVAQHPLYWYSCPALFKQWMDLVLTHGFAYGTGGTALAGKRWLTVVTAGGSEGAYQPQGRNRFAVEELLRPFEATAKLCHMTWQAPLILHGGHTLAGSMLEASAQRYRAQLEALRNGVAQEADHA